MLQLAALVKEIRRFASDPSISDEVFLNSFINAYVVAGKVHNKNGDELHLDKAATSQLLNQRVDVPQALLKAARQYGIKEKTEDGMSDFVEDFLRSDTLPELKERLLLLVSQNNTVNNQQELSTDSIVRDISILLADLLIASFSETNKIEPHRCVIWKSGANLAEVITGDIFHYGFGNRKKTKKNIVVIPVNTAFDTHVTRKLEGNSRPIVSTSTLHGQWLLRMAHSGTDISNLDIRIANSLKCLGFKPVTYDNDRNGKPALYPLGSCSLIETENANYILVAISEFDKMNNAQSTPAIIDTAIKSLLQTYDKIGQGYDMYIPLIGTGRSRAGLSMDDAYKLLRSCIVNNTQLIQGHVYLVIRPEDAAEICWSDNQ